MTEIYCLTYLESVTLKFGHVISMESQSTKNRMLILQQHMQSQKFLNDDTSIITSQRSKQTKQGDIL